MNGVEKRRRRAQSSSEAELKAENPPVLSSEMLREQAEEKPASPRRRRRVQPPQQITQRIPRIDIPDDEQIPKLPVIEETNPEKKRYSKRARPAAPKENKKDEAALAERREKQEKAVKACAGAGKAALGAIGGALLAGLMMLREGAGKCSVWLKKQAARIEAESGRFRNQAENGQKVHEEIELEAIRPEDYHGRGVQHAAQQQKDGKKNAKVFAGISNLQKQQLISAALVLVAVVSLFNIASILLRTFRTTRLNAQLSERYASMGGNQENDDAMTFTVYEAAEEPVATMEPEAALMFDEISESEETAEPVIEEPAAQETQKPQATPAPVLVKTTKFHHMGGDALPEMEALYNENRDLVAWLNIPEILDLPVVYKDNSYYLKRDFNKQKNTAGTIFLDENHPFKEKTQNLLLHGHNMKDGTMFGRLTQYIYDRTYIKNHPFINLSTLWRKEQYVIFAVLDVSLDPKNEKFFNYFTHATFSSDAEFTSYIRQLQLRSMFAIPIDVQPSDALLTLSTCLEENRLVIVARRLRPGETRQEMRDRIHTATRQ